MKSYLHAMQLGIATLTLAACGLSDAASSIEAKAGSLSANLARAEQPAACPQDGAALQVLGSGGPIAEADRAGTSYLLWIDGTPRLLIDAGSGSFLRFAESGAKAATLDAILLTHLHTDHTGDLPDLLNTLGFERRTAALPIIGPEGAPRFPSTSAFLERLISKPSGAWSHNGGFIDGTENKPMVEPRDVLVGDGSGSPTGLDVSNDYSVIAIPVMHGPVPALGYRVEIEGKSFVITGDQNGFSEAFDNAARDTQPDILFAHHVINGNPGQPRGLHRTPEEIGQLASVAKAKRLVLTHNMNRSLSDLPNGLKAIEGSYKGSVSVAKDLDCFAL